MTKDRGKTKYILLSLALAVVAVVIVKISLAQNPQLPQDGGDPAAYEERKALAEAFRRGGLKEVAKIKGNYISYGDPHPDWLALDMESLTKSSTAAIVGVPVKNHCEIASNGRTILTIYDVFVQETLKGDIREGDIIKVALMGGKVTFEDGTTAELRTPGFRKMVNGRTYALYLSQHEIRPGVYDLTAGPQGMVELPDDDTEVKSQARDTDPVKNQVKGKGAKAFLKEARKLAKQWPQPGKCCK